MCQVNAIRFRMIHSNITNVTFSFAAFFVSGSIQLTYLRLSSNAHLISATISSA